MSVDVSPAQLLEVSSGQMVEAELWDAITDQQLDHWEDDWMPALKQAVQRLKQAGVDRSLLPQSRHWDWRLKAEAFKGLLANPSFSVMCQGMTQGMMIVDNLGEGRLPQQAGKSLTYIEFIENAPWNRKGLLSTHPRFVGVGSLLLRAAIEVSRNEGFKGRVGLHSLPQSNAWYAKCGMTDLGPDPKKQDLRYFEMTPDQANAFIAKGNQP